MCVPPNPVRITTNTFHPQIMQISQRGQGRNQKKKYTIHEKHEMTLTPVRVVLCRLVDRCLRQNLAQIKNKKLNVCFTDSSTGTTAVMLTVNQEETLLMSLI